MLGGCQAWRFEWYLNLQTSLLLPGFAAAGNTGEATALGSMAASGSSNGWGFV